MALKIRLEGKDDELKNNIDVTILNISHHIEIEFKENILTNTENSLKPQFANLYNPASTIEHLLQENQTPSYKEFERDVIGGESCDALLETAEKWVNPKQEDRPMRYPGKNEDHFVQIDDSKNHLLNKAKRILNGKPDKNLGYKKGRTNDSIDWIKYKCLY